MSMQVIDVPRGELVGSRYERPRWAPPVRWHPVLDVPRVPRALPREVPEAAASQPGGASDAFSSGGYAPQQPGYGPPGGGMPGGGPPPGYGPPGGGPPGYGPPGFGPPPGKGYGPPGMGPPGMAPDPYGMGMQPDMWGKGGKGGPMFGKGLPWSCPGGLGV